MDTYYHMTFLSTVITYMFIGTSFYLQLVRAPSQSHIPEPHQAPHILEMSSKSPFSLVSMR